MSGGIVLTSRLRERDQIARTARGLLTENFPLGATTAASIGVDGTAYFMLVGFRAGDVITGVGNAISTAGGSLTLSKVGLYDTAGTRLAISAELGTSWQSGGMKANVFTAPYTITTEGGYYLAVITKGTTQPTWNRQAAANDKNAGINGGSVLFGIQLAQTDLPASATIVQNSSACLNLWVGAY